MKTERTDEQRAAISAIKSERARDKAAAMHEYQAERLAVQANFARLRALRLARESAQAEVAAAEPAKKATKKRSLVLPPPPSRQKAPRTPLRTGPHIDDRSTIQRNRSTARSSRRADTRKTGSPASST